MVLYGFLHKLLVKLASFFLKAKSLLFYIALNAIFNDFPNTSNNPRLFLRV